MNILLFLVGLYCLIQKQDAYVLAIIVFLASQYFQLSLDEYTPLLSDVHTDDLGILLYLCFFIKTVRGRSLVWKSKIAKCTTFLLIYIVANGVLDVFLGTSVIDVVKELRHYIFFFFCIYISTCKTICFSQKFEDCILYSNVYVSNSFITALHRH